MAADEKIPVTLEASIVGKKLYLKNGFKNVNEVELCAECSDALMVWEPKGMEGTWLEENRGESAKMKGRKE